MSTDFPSELLSAYLDQEATAAQRALVEHRLEKSSESRLLLDEWRQLSCELQSLPRDECPRDLAPRVWRAIEAGRRTTAAGPPAASRRAGLLRNMAALVVTAAAMVLALIALNPAPEPLRQRENPGRGESGGTLTNRSEPGTKANEISKARGEVNGIVATGQSGKGNGKLAGASVFGAGIPPDPLVPPIRLQAGGTSGNGTPGTGLVFIDDLKKLSHDDVGRVLTAIEHSPQGISVVRLTVVDCRHGLDALQVLLARNRIPRQPAGTAGTAANKDANPTAAGTEKRLLAVYVQSPPERLASVVSELRSNDQFRRLQVEPPISPRRLDPLAQHQIAMLDALRDEDHTGLGSESKRRLAMRSFTSGRQKSSAFGRTAGSNAGNAGKKGDAFKSDGKTNESRDKSAKDAAGGASALAELDRISRQLQLTVPAGLFETDSRTGRLIAARRANSQPAARGDSGRSAQRQRDSRTAVRRPVRVLFVLVCPPPVKSPAAQGARKSGS